MRTLRSVVFLGFVLWGLGACEDGRPQRKGRSAPPPQGGAMASDATRAQPSGAQDSGRSTAWVHTQALPLVEAALGEVERGEFEKTLNNPLMRHFMFRASLASMAQAPDGAVDGWLVARVYELAGHLSVSRALYARLGDEAGLSRVSEALTNARLAQTERAEQVQKRKEAAAGGAPLEPLAPEVMGPGGTPLVRLDPPIARLKPLMVRRDDPHVRERPIVEPRPTAGQLEKAHARVEARRAVVLPLVWEEGVVDVGAPVEVASGYRLGMGAPWSLTVRLDWALERLGPFDLEPVRYGASFYLPQPFSGSESLRFQQMRVTLPWHTSSAVSDVLAHEALVRALCGEGSGRAEPVVEPELTRQVGGLGWRVVGHHARAMRCEVLSVCQGPSACVTLWLGGAGRWRLGEMAVKLLAQPEGQP